MEPFYPPSDQPMPEDYYFPPEQFKLPLEEPEKKPEVWFPWSEDKLPGPGPTPTEQTEQ